MRLPNGWGYTQHNNIQPTTLLLVKVVCPQGLLSMDIAVVVEDKTGQNQNKVKTDLSKTKVPKINKKITE